MLCYLGWIKELFDELDVEVNSANAKSIDRRIHALCRVDYENCPEAWTRLKEMRAEDEEMFKTDLAQALSSYA
jgi:tryptophan 2,3-dioxygenase